MSAGDKLVYFTAHGRAEPTRMLYIVAGKSLNDVRVTHQEWPIMKGEQPLGQVPVFHCEEGSLVMSRTIARFAAKRLGLVGETAWDEAMNDMVVETCSDCMEEITREVYYWLIFKRCPEPEDSAKVKEAVRGKIVKSMNFIQSLAEKKGKKFILDDKILFADIGLYCFLEFGRKAFPDLLEITPWVKEFVEKFQNDERIKNYLATRPPSPIGI
ncbi:probable glutathione S-transferase 8 [Watersipora subatra]|uniref:probable glutathione S-transferase 8 n=1 Tax=Watersipora subatra TaxID=2589382 RepID=UPI00355B2A90